MLGESLDSACITPNMLLLNTVTADLVDAPLLAFFYARHLVYNVASWLEGLSAMPLMRESHHRTLAGSWTTDGACLRP